MHTGHMVSAVDLGLEQPPKDRYGAAYAIFFLVGMGTLIPWNVFITARAYFDLRLFKPPYTPALSDSFESIFGIAFMTTNLVALAVFVRVGGVAALPPFAQVPAPLLVMSVLLAFTGVLTFAGGLSGNAMTAWTLATLLLLGAVTAVVQGGSFAMASNLPPAYNQALMGGQAVAGVLSAVVAMVSTLSLSGGGGGGEGSGRRDDRHDNTTAGRTGKYMTSSGEEEGGIGAKVGDDSSSRAASQAAAYFFTAAALMFACFVGGLFLERVPFYRHHVAAAAAARRGDNERESRRKQLHERQRPRHVAGSGTDWDETSAVPLLGRMEEEDEEDEDCRSGDDVYLEASGDDSTHEEEGRSEYVSASEGGGDRSLSPPSPTSRSSSPSSPAPSSAASDVRCYRVSVFVTFAVTLAVFPAVTSSICSARNPAVIPPCAPDPPGAGGRFFGDLWVPSFFLVFNVMDFLGRCAANVWPKAPLTGRTVAAMAFSRLALLPPLLMCNVVTARRWNLPRLLASSDLAPALLISALAFTNGHMGSTCMMFGPSLVPLGKRAEEGSKMSLAVIAGLAAGSALSFGVSAAFQS